MSSDLVDDKDVRSAALDLVCPCSRNCFESQYYTAPHDLTLPVTNIPGRYNIIELLPGHIIKWELHHSCIRDPKQLAFWNDADCHRHQNEGEVLAFQLGNIKPKHATCTLVGLSR